MTPEELKNYIKSGKAVKVNDKTDLSKKMKEWISSGMAKKIEKTEAKEKTLDEILKEVPHEKYEKEWHKSRAKLFSIQAELLSKKAELGLLKEEIKEPKMPKEISEAKETAAKV